MNSKKKFLTIFIYIIISLSLFALFENFSFELALIYTSFLFALIVFELFSRFHLSNYLFSKKLALTAVFIIYFLNVGLTYLTITNHSFIDYKNCIMLKPIAKSNSISIEEIIEDIKSQKYMENILEVEGTGGRFVFKIVGANYQLPILNKIGIFLLAVSIFYLLFLFCNEQKNSVSYRKIINFTIIGSFIYFIILNMPKLIPTIHQDITSISKKDFLGRYNIIHINKNNKANYTIYRRVK